MSGWKWLEEVESEFKLRLISNGRSVLDLNPEIHQLIACIKTMKKTLDKISADTYGTELCNSREENNEILVPWVFRYQKFAREALAKCAEGKFDE